MCRIAGIISNRLTPAEINQKLKLMCHALKHGGPDDEGIFIGSEKNVGFGHRRLSIIDLSNNGHQPMADVEEKAWITFNGEIYNYLELKKKLLLLGVKFHSNTDTEVIIQAYLQWGTTAFERLNGMFAFALYDKLKAVTYLVRDVSGIKPLYYYAENEQLAFASEVKALQVAGIATEEDKNWPIRFLAFGHIPEPYTTFYNVLSLPKGHYLAWNNHTHSCALHEFNSAKAKIEIEVTDVREAHEQIRDILGKSVQRQLIADASVGVFLSGGLDSSLITLLANQQKQTRLKTVSIYFDEKSYDESSYQKVILDKVDGEKHSHLVKQADFEESFPQIIDAMDMPTTDGINTWFISKFARQDGLKAVLSGIGADELYGGYPSSNRIEYLKYLKKIPASLLSAASPFMADQYKRFEYLKFDHPAADYLFLRALFAPSDIAKILNVSVKQVTDVLFDYNLAHKTRTYDKDYASFMERNFYMQNQLLRDTDVMSMNHGLEVRVPFLDELFINLTLQIDPAIRFANQPPKEMLIDSFKDILPEAIWNRSKMGFSFPLQQWMQQHPEISNEANYDGKVTRELIKKFKANKLHWSKSFALYQLKKHE